MENLSLLIKPASSGCNLGCKYCFYANVSDIRKIKNYGVMNDDTTKMLIKKVFSINPHSVSFAFQGGEPTLAGLKYYNNFVATVKKYNTASVQINYAIQSNGILIDDEFAEFFTQNNFLVGISLDGNKEINDQYRQDKNGKSIFNKVIKALEILKKHNTQFNILSVLTNNNSRFVQKIYNFYKKMGFKYLQFIPCIDDFGSQNCSLTVERYEYFLKTIFDLWYYDLINGDYVSIRHLDNYVNMLKGNGPENCAMSGICGNYFVVESNGDLYPCDFYCTDEYKLGTIFDNNPFEDSQKHQDFIKKSYLLNKDCKQCKYHFICRGGCRRDREPDLVKNKYCKAYYAFFDYALSKLTKIAG